MRFQLFMSFIDHTVIGSDLQISTSTGGVFLRYFHFYAINSFFLGKDQRDKNIVEKNETQIYLERINRN